MEGKTVCWVRGYNLFPFIELDSSKYKVHEVNNAVSGIQMLKIGRVDFYVDVNQQIDKDLKVSKIDPTIFDQKPLFSQKLYLAFSNSERGKQLRDIWDRQMETMHNSTAVKNIFTKHNQDFAY
ncbi:MAG: transporter substrate-binding domain-containing protein [Chitinivibrionales bacterium]|nr:transporter substrate-binding domain-containing protein [Chitinivibrionales bacterium]